jgi:hypothetical protein
MKIHRHLKEHNFTIIDNALLRDTRLSFRARGLLTYLLSMGDDWETDSVRIAAQTREGRDAVRTTLTELEACGYLRRSKFRTRHGMWTSRWELFEEPLETPDQSADLSRSGPVDEARRTSA